MRPQPGQGIVPEVNGFPLPSRLVPLSGSCSTPTRTTLSLRPLPHCSNRQAQCYGCMSIIMMLLVGFKALIPVDQWVLSLPATSKFVLGHDAQTKVQGGTTNRTAVSIYFEFSNLMDYNSITQPIWCVLPQPWGYPQLQQTLCSA